MTQNWRSRRWKFTLASALAMGGAIASSRDCTFAQIIQDGSLGAESSVVTPNVIINGLPSDRIDGGAIRGANLFHSFQEFNVATGRGAYFTNPAGIENILTRVTGTNASNIFGMLGVIGGNANLFLINPNGIIFGENARLNVGGSFVATTANAVGLANGDIFSANPVEPLPNQLLTVNPNAFFFNRIAAASISSQASLQVRGGQSLLLVGGNMQLNGGVLKALGGRVELGGVAGTGTIGLSLNGNNLRLSFPVGVPLSDVSLTNEAGVFVRAGSGGSIAINAQNLNIAGESSLLAGIASGMGSIGSIAGDIEINATRAINLTDDSFIENVVEKGGVGKGGDINITTEQLLVSDGALVGAGTFGSGDGGNLIINASEGVQLIGGAAAALFPSGLFAQTTGTGAAGKLEITTRQLLVSDGAVVSATTFFSGKGGDLIIHASDSVQVIGGTPDGQRPSGLFAQTGGTGAAGKLEITTRQLLISGGAQVAAGTIGSGNGGNLIVNVSNSVQVIGNSSDGQRASGLITDTAGIGAAGKLEITTRQLLVSDGAQVSASTRNSGKGGNLIVNASDSVQVIGTTPDGQFSSALFAETRGTGEAGNVEITTRQLLVVDGAKVSASTRNSGKGGSLIVNASDSVQVIGTTPDGQFPSALFAATTSNSTGNGGGIYISTNNLDLTNGAVISAQSGGRGKAGDITIHAFGALNLNNGQISATAAFGDAGNINVSASSIRLNNATIRADTKREQGNINLNSVDLVLRRGSNITTNAEGSTVIGGNINIDTGVLAALEDSDISANSRDFRGGNVTITAQGIFGTAFRPALTPESDITATGADSSLSGTVTLITPDADPSRGLTNLPTEVVDASNQIAQNCRAGGAAASEQSSFVVTGRGGLPPNPKESLNSDDVFVNWVPLNPRRENRSSPAVSTKATSAMPTPVVEAQGWVINDKGQVVLTATAPTVTPHSSWQTQNSCRVPQSQARVGVRQ